MIYRPVWRRRLVASCEAEVLEVREVAAGARGEALDEAKAGVGAAAEGLAVGGLVKAAGWVMGKEVAGD